ALPKPQEIKAKTINEIDTWLGAKPANRGLVGFFEPTLPEHTTGIDAVPGLWNKIESRFHQRAEEYAQLSEKMTRLAAEDSFHVRDGVVYGYNDNRDLVPVTGDHDVFDITDRNDVQLPSERYARLVETMVGNDMGVQHGAHMYWRPEGTFDHKIFDKIV